MCALVSIIIPVYNVEEYLEQCLQSLVSQTYQNIEIFLVDDGSSDNSGSICDKYGQLDRRINVVHQKNQGVSVARNTGISYSSGKYIIFVDADDWLELDCCERVVTEAEKRNVDILYFQRCEEQNNKTKLFKSVNSYFLTIQDIEEIKLEMISVRSGKYCFKHTTPWSKVYKRNIIVENKLLFVPGIKMAEDVIFNLHYLDSVNSAAFFDYVGYHYRVNNDSIMNKYSVDIFDIVTKLAECLSDYIKRQEKKSYENAFGQRCVWLLESIEKLYVFHIDSHVSKEEAYSVFYKFFSNSIFQSCIDEVHYSDFRDFKSKLRLYCIKNRNVFLWYHYFIIKKIRKRFRKNISNGKVC